MSKRTTLALAISAIAVVGLPGGPPAHTTPPASWSATAPAIFVGSNRDAPIVGRQSQPDPGSNNQPSSST